MKKERLLFLRKEYIEAIQYCNELVEDEPFSDLETAEENFWTDVFMLAFFAICADKKSQKMNSKNSTLLWPNAMQTST